MCFPFLGHSHRMLFRMFRFRCRFFQTSPQFSRSFSCWGTGITKVWAAASGCLCRRSVLPSCRSPVVPASAGAPNKDLNVFTCFTNNRSVKKQKDVITSSTAQGGGGSFKNRKPIGEVGCCESGMAERSHWLTERWLELCLLEWLQWLQWSPHPQLLDVVWCTATVVVVVA